MPRWATTLVGVVVVGLAVWLVVTSYRPPTPIGRSLKAEKNDAAPEDDGAALLFAYGDAGATREAGPLLVSDLALPELRVDGGVGSLLADGTLVPPLPMTAPRQVRFGVVLVSYAGAQPSVAGGRPASRSKADAKTLADKLHTTAEQDFHAAVQQGDAGSADDLGRVKLGILEPAAEYVLFSLPIGAVGAAVDTPRGYWVVKRLE